MEGKQRAAHERLFFEFEGSAAMIEGAYKIVKPKGASWELYDLGKDRTETKNLAASDPTRVAALSATWDAWYKSVPH
jgi:arylsulfatase